MVGKFFLFLGALWGSWMVWAGGILRMIPFLEDMIEPWLRNKYPRIDAWFHARGEALKKDLKLIAVICLFIGCYRAWVFEHNNAQTAMYGKDGKSEAWAKYNECDKERAVNDSLAKSCGTNLSYQQSRNDGQQDLFNRCMLALGVKGVPEALKITVQEASFAIPGGRAEHSGMNIMSALVMKTNKMISPTHGILTCSKPFMLFDAEFAMGPHWTMKVKNALIAANQAKVEIESPSWNPEIPLVVLVSSGGDLSPCNFKLD